MGGGYFTHHSEHNLIIYGHSLSTSSSLCVAVSLFQMVIIDRSIIPDATFIGIIYTQRLIACFVNSSFVSCTGNEALRVITDAFQLSFLGEVFHLGPILLETFRTKTMSKFCIGVLTDVDL